ncbi:hypothetical protein AV530_011238 [Patagioenas fasciata monilis]|uniref:Uncharacterized protein n=1 Tax=Patagioenas fasciata monilis TaxID=372326 RepID=A0A1V4KNK9_PATFA|nr:hypothetical protein AV530_011238 [Patagioenas fasciata monilis]
MAAVLGSAHVLEPGGENTDGLCPAEFLFLFNRLCRVGGISPKSLCASFPAQFLPPGVTCGAGRTQEGAALTPGCAPAQRRYMRELGNHCTANTEISTNSPDSKGSRLKTQLGKQDTDQISLILEDKSIVCREETVPANPNTTTGEARRGALRSYPGAAAGIPKLDIRQRDVGAQRSRPTVHHTSR